LASKWYAADTDFFCAMICVWVPLCHVWQLLKGQWWPHGGLVYTICCACTMWTLKSGQSCCRLLFGTLL
jgi:hypothetical protein